MIRSKYSTLTLLVDRKKNLAPRETILADQVYSGHEDEVSAQKQDPALMTIGQAAAWLNLSPKSVQRRIKAGVIRTVPLGGRLVRISFDELRRLTADGLSQDDSENPDLIR